MTLLKKQSSNHDRNANTVGMILTISEEFKNLKAIEAADAIPVLLNNNLFALHNLQIYN